MNPFQGKNSVITGGSSGIGKALALAIAKEGGNVCIAGRDSARLSQVAQTIHEMGQKAVVVQMDVTIEEECAKLITTAVKELGSIDILICNAGVSMRGSFEDTSTDVYRRLMDVNFFGALQCAKAGIEELEKSKGSLVAVSSVIGLKGIPGRSGYAASKAAMNALFETIRIEYLERNVHVLIALPGFTSGSRIRTTALKADGTEQGYSPTDESKMDHPDQVALDILQAIRDKKSTLLKNKQGRAIFWLNRYFPRLLDRKIHQAIAKEPNSPIK